MDKNNKYYNLIESLVKNHRKFPGYEAILDDIVDDVYSHSEVIFNSIENENVIKSYLERVISTSMIVVPKRLNFNSRVSHRTISTNVEDNRFVTPRSVLPPQAVSTEPQPEVSAQKTFEELVIEAKDDVNSDIKSFTDNIVSEKANTQFVDKMINTMNADFVDNSDKEVVSLEDNLEILDDADTLALEVDGSETVAEETYELSEEAEVLTLESENPESVAEETYELSENAEIPTLEADEPEFVEEEAYELSEEAEATTLETEEPEAVEETYELSEDAEVPTLEVEEPEAVEETYELSEDTDIQVLEYEDPNEAEEVSDIGAETDIQALEFEEPDTVEETIEQSEEIGGLSQDAETLEHDIQDINTELHEIANDSDLETSLVDVNDTEFANLMDDSVDDSIEVQSFEDNLTQTEFPINDEDLAADVSEDAQEGLFELNDISVEEASHNIVSEDDSDGLAIQDNDLSIELDDGNDNLLFSDEEQKDIINTNETVLNEIDSQEQDTLSVSEDSLMFEIEDNLVDNSESAGIEELVSLSEESENSLIDDSLDMQNEDFQELGEDIELIAVNNNDFDCSDNIESLGSIEEQDEYTIGLVETDKEAKSEKVTYKPADYTVFNYNPNDIQNAVDVQQISEKLLELDARMPNLNVLSVFELRYKKDYTLEQIATELNIDKDNVVNILNKIVELV